MIQGLDQRLHQAIKQYMEVSGKLSVDQHGFRKGDLCESNLLSFYDHFSKSLLSRKAVDIIFLDFAKVFNALPHKQLINRLKTVGVESLLCHWIKGSLKGPLY